MAIKDAAVTLRISPNRCYAILRATGRPVGSPRPTLRKVSAAYVAAMFTATGSINQAAEANGISHGAARRLLVEAGLVSENRQPRGKAAARTRFFELLESGWSVARAAREVGVHERTARDWRDGIRKYGNTRILSNGKVIHYGDSA
ncbi:helix-turn-helix domain-containing protein, partial [Mycolicibacterium sp. CR10]|uniref:helix-turn-helix domain-containing protein n=1 Tax=Mycolicibacterium sp. CR10 TaxID=2562314 RepID=UPI00197CB542